MGNLYTIGHSRHEIDDFLELLRQHGVDFVLDVRSTPYSKYADQFNREPLEWALQNAGLEYHFMGTYFGARPDDKSLYCDEGYLDFARVRKSPRFLAGVNSVRKGLEMGRNIALMCAEQDPFDCHRAIMVSRAFELAGIEVNHILKDGNLQSQAKLNERLLDKYYPNIAQVSFFDATDRKEDWEYLEMAYQQRNREIGYRPDSRKAENQR